MTGFDEAWLRLREPVDAASRDRELVARLARVRAQRPIHVVDLGTGTAANLRYLSPLLGGAQIWYLIDRDRALLDAIPDRLSEWAKAIGASVRDAGDGQRIDGAGFECEVHARCADIAESLSALELPAEPLITASALLDLVSARWLEALAERCRESRATVLLALSYDGRLRFEPDDSADALVRELFNAHQLTDKGFGPALGPAAASRAALALERAGLLVETARSDWKLGPRQRALQLALIEGYLAAALERAPAQAAELVRWGERRRALAADGASRLIVGHTDLLGLRPDQRFGDVR